MLTCKMFVLAPPIKHIKFQSNSHIDNAELQVMSHGDRTNVSLLKGELPFQQKTPVVHTHHSDPQPSLK